MVTTWLLAACALGLTLGDGYTTFTALSASEHAYEWNPIAAAVFNHVGLLAGVSGLTAATSAIVVAVAAAPECEVLDRIYADIILGVFCVATGVAVLNNLNVLRLMGLI